MNSFQIASLPFAGMRFKEWKIKDNSKLSIGDPIFLYEYKINGVAKKEKYKSTLNGITVKNLANLKTDDRITKNLRLFDYEKCTHPVISYDMCGVCGEDLKSQNEIARKTARTSKPDDAAASVKIVHAEPRIKVSKNEALEIGKRDLDNLVRQKKLVLLVDLDQTIIHTTNDNVSNLLKDVFHYELFQKNVWYHTKFRPNCERFLEEMSKLYELHMVTFGERSYAHKIASFIDPERRLFHDRILSRNELDNPISKTDNLKALFPRGDSMVCIIDDREDVWNYARNLICVQPYFYFKNTGDINDPHKASAKNSKKRKMLENMNAYKKVETNSEVEKSSEENLNVEENLMNILTDSKSNELTIDNNSVDSTLSSSSSNSSESVSEEKKKDLLTKKSKVSETNKENSTQKAEESSSSAEEIATSQPPPTTDQLDETDDPDDYIDYLQQILTSIHDEYYKIYENRIRSKASESIEVDETDLPDLKRVIPMLKSRILENVVITFSGVVPTDYDLKKQKCYWMATSLGAKINEHLVLGDGSDIENSKEELEETQKKNSKNYEYSYDESSSSNTSGGDSKNDSSFSSTSNDSIPLSINNENKNNTKRRKRLTTHLVAAKFGTSKVHEALKSKRKVHVVTPEWLINCNFKWQKCEEKFFALTKEYEYKNCMFHKEYNIHQKFASASAVSSTSSTVISNTKLTVNMSDTKSSTINRKRQFNEVSSTTTETTSSLTSVQVKDKEQTPGRAKRSNSFFTSETFYSEEETKNSEFNLDEDLFDQMDKEVEEELDNEDSSEFEEEYEEEPKEAREDDCDLSATDKSSSMGSFEDDDIDDEMVLALEKNF